MNELDRKRFLATMRQDEEFRAAVRRELLTQELLDLPETVAVLSETVRTLVDVAAQQRQDFASLTAEVRNYMERTISLVGEGFTTVSAAIDDRFTAVDARFTAIDDRFTAIDDRFTAIDARFTAVDAQLDQIKADIRVIRDRLAS